MLQSLGRTKSGCRQAAQRSHSGITIGAMPLRNALELRAGSLMQDDILPNPRDLVLDQEFAPLQFG